MMHPSARAALSASLAIALLLVAPAGCAILGVAANAVPPEPVKPKVVLANTSVGVMVWADRSLRVSWPTLQKDLGARIQYDLQAAHAADPKAKELLNVTYPYPAESYVRWQSDHPEYAASPIADIVPRLHVQRLIYVEFDAFDTRSPNTESLFRGSAKVTLHVFETPPGASVANELYQEKISVTYPKASTEDGRPDSSDAKMYAGTVPLLGDEIAKRFVQYTPEAH